MLFGCTHATIENPCIALEIQADAENRWCTESKVVTMEHESPSVKFYQSVPTNKPEIHRKNAMLCMVEYEKTAPLWCAEPQPHDYTRFLRTIVPSARGNLHGEISPDSVRPHVAKDSAKNRAIEVGSSIRLMAQTWLKQTTIWLVDAPFLEKVEQRRWSQNLADYCIDDHSSEFLEKCILSLHRGWQKVIDTEGNYIFDWAVVCMVLEEI